MGLTFGGGAKPAAAAPAAGGFSFGAKPAGATANFGSAGGLGAPAIGQGFTNNMGGSTNGVASGTGFTAVYLKRSTQTAVLHWKHWRKWSGRTM